MNLVIRSNRQTSSPFLLISGVSRASPANETYRRDHGLRAMVVSELEKTNGSEDPAENRVLDGARARDLDAKVGPWMPETNRSKKAACSRLVGE